jgi:hypothetical protein
MRFNILSGHHRTDAQRRDPVIHLVEKGISIAKAL